MKKTVQSILSLVMVITLMVSFLPESLAAAIGENLASASGAAEDRPIPVRALTALQTENAASVEAQLASAGEEGQEGDFLYRLLPDGTAAVTGYTGASADVALPRALAGADVTAIASGAFGAAVKSVTVHGNVFYMAPDALAAGTAVSAWQGSYAAAWAQAQGRALRSETEGVLYPTVADMTDVLDRINVLSDSLVSAPALEARRLAVGDTFILNRGNADESFFTVTAKRNIGVKVYITVEKADVSAVYSYRLYEGETTLSHTFTGEEEVGVGQEEGEVEAASQEYEEPAHTETETNPIQPEVSIPLGKLGSLAVSYKIVTKITSSYHVVIENGKIIKGNMSQQQEDTHTLEVKFKHKGKFKYKDKDGNEKEIQIEGGVVGMGMTEEERQSALELLKELKDKEPDKKLGSYVFYIIPAIGVGIEIAPSVGWEMGGSGSWTWVDRTLNLYEYNRNKDAWGLLKDNSVSLPAPSPTFTGSVYGKVSASISVNFVSLWVTSELHFSFSVSIGFNLSYPLDPLVCARFKVDFNISISIEAGLWFSLGKWEFKVASAAKKTFTLFNATILDAHYNRNQHLHSPTKCAYTPADYSIRFVTQTDWKPDSICYLMDGTYSHHLVTIQYLTLSSESAWGNAEAEPNEVNRIDFDYLSHPDGLDGKVTLPQHPAAAVDHYTKWRMVDPAPITDYYWNEDLTVKQNLVAATGKNYDTQDALPKTIVLEEDLSDKYHIVFDANGGSFSSGNVTGPLMTKYYVPGEKCEVPPEEPIKDLAVFSKWTLDAEGTILWNGESAIQENLHVYAQYDSYDPVNHETINSRYGKTPTLIGQTGLMNKGQVNWYLTIGGIQPDSALLDRILTIGVNAYELSADGITYLSTHGPLSCTDELRNVKGSVTSEGQVSLTGLVDPTKHYYTFTVPSTLNGMPMGVEDTMMRNLRADTVVFGAAPASGAFIKVDDMLFRNNTYVQRVYMDTTGYYALGDEVFYGCVNLESVSLPGTLQKIGKRAFQGCTKLTQAEFGLQVDTIGTDAFKDCVNLTAVSVSTPFMESMQNAFRDSAGTESHIDLILTDMVRVLPSSAFYGCTAIKSLQVAAGARLSEIGTSAFNSTSLTTMQLNEGLQTINALAFANTQLTEAEIPASVTSYYVPTSNNNSSSNVFYQTPIRKMTIGGGITQIPQYMFSFQGYQSVSTIEEIVLREGVTEIGNSAFYINNVQGVKIYDNLKKITLPTTLETIGSYAFNYAQALEKIGVDPDHQQASVVIPDGITTIPDHAFYYCKGLTSAVIPSSVQEIGKVAFCGTSLNSLKLSEGLQTIRAMAFANTNLTNVGIPASVTDYYAQYHNHVAEASNVFYGTPLKKLTIGGEITKINKWVLYDISTIEEVVLREGVTEIEENAFSGQSNLKKITLPTTLTAIGTSAFSGALALEKIGVDPDHQQASLVIPDGVTAIPDYAFTNCKGLTSAVIPSSVREIGLQAFMGTPLTSIKLSEGLQTIQMNAFASTMLEEIEIPASVTSYYTNSTYAYCVFNSVPLKKITFGGGITKITEYMFGYIDTIEEIVLREGVTEIGAGAFRSMNALKKITLPTTLTAIGNSAFSNAQALERIGVDPDHQRASLVIPDGVTAIPDYAFTNCKGLTSAVIPPSVQEIGTEAFKNTSLTSIQLSEGLQTIKSSAFANTQLTEVEIPASVTSYYAQYGTARVFNSVPLKRITFGGGITRITEYMFSYIDTIEEIVLREGVTEIGGNAFKEFKNLKKITLPRSLTSVGANAFYNATALTDVITGPNLNSIGSNAFYNAHPTFYALPGTEANAWLAQWCQENGFIYDPQQTLKIQVCFDDGLEDTENPVTEAEAFGLISEPETPQREGWSFLGWFQGNAQEPWDFAQDHVTNLDITLTARWMQDTANGLYRIDNGGAKLLSYALSDGDATAVAIPPTWQGQPVTAIAEGAFDGEPVTAITLPASVTQCSTAAFAGADSLNWITVQQGNPAFISRNGILYSADGTTLIYCPEGKIVKSFTVPEGVTAIGEGAFQGHDELTQITFNDSLLTIGKGAFQGCGLEDLTLPDGLQAIGEDAFRYCYSLKSARGAARCGSIGNNAFASTGRCIFYGAENSALARYAEANHRPSNIYSVSYYLDGEKADEVWIKSGEDVPDMPVQAPEGRAVVPGWYADAEMTQAWDFENEKMPLADLILYAATLPLFDTAEYVPQAPEGQEAAPAGLRVTGYHGSALAVTIPQTIGGLTVYAVNADAFAAGSAVTLPESLLEIDPAAFAQANILLYAPAGSETEQMLLAAGYELNSAPRILSFQTNGGSLLGSVTVPAGGETTLPDCVRDGCTLTGWYADEALTVLAGAAGDPYAMPDADVTLYAAWDGAALEYAFEWEQRGNSIAVIGSKNAASVEIPALINGLPVTLIAENAFSSDTALTMITLPEGLTEIGAFAFYGTGLREVTLPGTVTSVGQYAFASCPSLKKAVWPASAPTVGVGVFSGDGKLTGFTLPEGVTGLGDYALEGCGLTAFTIPDSVTRVGSRALSDMTALETLTLGQNTAAFSSDALDGCTALKTIQVSGGNTHFESVNGVLYYADRAGIARYPAGADQASYTIDPAAMLIESHAFANANALKSLALPDGIVQMGPEAFAGSGLTAIDLSPCTELTAIPSRVFANCSMLTQAILPAGLTSIGSEAFLRCFALDSLDIPDAVTAIGDSAFDDHLTLFVGENTEAQRYAQAKGLAYWLRDQTLIPAEEITAEKASLTLLKGVAYTLNAAVSPVNSTDLLQWFCGDADILRVDNGMIRPLKAGETEIVLFAGDAELTVPVTVVEHWAQIEQSPALLYSGSTVQLTVRCIADNTSGSGIQWSCEGGSVSADGLFTVTESGIATVTVLDENGPADTVSFACVASDGVMRLPAALGTVEDEAFRGLPSVQAVIVPSGMTAIGDHAFADCANLRIIMIPDSVVLIGESAFENSGNVAIVCSAGSAAASYAESNGVNMWIIP